MPLVHIWSIVMSENSYQIPPPIHQYEAKFYGMSMTGLLVAAVFMIGTFIACQSIFSGVTGLVVGVIGGLIFGIVGWAMATPFSSMDGMTPPRYWIKLFQTRNDRDVIMPDFSVAAEVTDEVTVTSWDGEVIAQL